MSLGRRDVSNKRISLFWEDIQQQLTFWQQPHYSLRELLHLGAPPNSKVVGFSPTLCNNLINNSEEVPNVTIFPEFRLVYLFWDLILPGTWWHHQWHNWYQKEMITPVSTHEVIFHKKETQTCSTSVLFLFFPLVLPFSLLHHFGFMGNHPAWTLP